MTEPLAQRSYQVASAYSDGNDANTLRLPTGYPMTRLLKRVAEILYRALSAAGSSLLSCV